MSAHPGPWRWERCYLRDSNGDAVFYDCYATTPSVRYGDDESRKLIAAAPELRDMVRRLMENLDAPTWVKVDLQKEARALLERVGG